ncbi:hypothetical protein MA16_Dca009010 [Dendrobium catenatum]|uniref:Uncharacterized protein n=1 Tax=Dendrobium catenatum TaxID=906689 RepID=A0A2I0VR97_9ASPA|nr:hypothetical protein MA16_Dca009010 [Dendrobium catenatum]
MGKKKNHSSPAAAESSETKAIDNLKNLNGQLVKEVEECRKQIEQLQFQLSTLASHHNILSGSDHNVSSIAERHITKAAAHDKAEMAVKKTESAAAQFDAEEMLLLALVTEKDETQSNGERVIVDKDCAIWCLDQSLEQSRKKSDAELSGGRKWKRWICSAIVATASFCVAVAVVTLCCPKNSNPKNYL